VWDIDGLGIIGPKKECRVGKEKISAILEPLGLTCEKDVKISHEQFMLQYIK